MQDDSESQSSLDQIADAVLTASRVLIAIAARSLAGEDISLPQYRALVILASKGPERLAELAEALSVNPSSATRLCDRLISKQLITRIQTSDDRRGVTLKLTTQGRSLVDDVTERRRQEIYRVISAIPEDERAHLVTALQALSRASGETPDPDWALEW